ncbi:hypothetical protein DR864_09040 [Runella rosea]|uniref:Uncharacterized protein n=1 Tax=Runella rosea TaxID=2259595 RepID=A0A344TGU7_9BACT|nr:hypothetical protein DR864_09040 [Runella rosea]
MSIQHVLLAILKIYHRHHALDVHCFQYGMKIVQGSAAFFCPSSPIFAFKPGEHPFLWRCFVF